MSDDVIIKTENANLHVSDYESGAMLSIFLRGGYACAYLDYAQTVELVEALNQLLTSDYKKAREGSETADAI